MEVKITRMVTKGLTGKTKAFFSISLDNLVEIDDLRLIDGSKGLFVGFPSKKIDRKTGETEYVDTVKLVRNKDGKRLKTSEELYNQILAAADEEFRRREGGEPVTAGTDEDDSDDLPF